MPWTLRARAETALVTVALAAALAGCTGDPVDEPAPPPETSASSAPILMVRPGPLTVRVAPVRGRITDRARNDLRRGVRRVIGAWMEGGFTGQSHPRTDYSRAFATYTPRAAGLARRQRAVTTNALLGPELVELVPTRRLARVSVLAAGGRAVGASAEVLLVLVGARADRSQVELVVRGELELTPVPGGWKVFGFDLARSVGAPGTYTAAVRERAGRRGPGGGTR
jgi:hypothetical protein